MSPEILENKRLANTVGFWPTAGRFVNKLCTGVFLLPIKGFKFSIMKKTNGTKQGTTFKRFITGTLVMATAMLFALPGKVSAGDTAQTITAPDIADKTYEDAAFSVAATSSSNLTVSYAAQGPARVDTAGELTITGAGTVKVFFFQNGDETYAAATPVVKTFAVAKKTVTVTVADSTVTYNGAAREVSGSASGGGNDLTVTETYAGNSTAPSAAGTYAVVATVDDANYQGTANATLTINAAPLTATLGTKSISYGTATPEAAASGVAVPYEIDLVPSVAVKGAALIVKVALAVP